MPVGEFLESQRAGLPILTWRLDLIEHARRGGNVRITYEVLHKISKCYVQFTTTFPGAWMLNATCEFQWCGNVSTIHCVKSSWLLKRGSQGRVMMLGGLLPCKQ